MEKRLSEETMLLSAEWFGEKIRQVILGRDPSKLDVMFPDRVIDEEEVPLNAPEMAFRSIIRCHQNRGSIVA